MKAPRSATRKSWSPAERSKGGQLIQAFKSGCGLGSCVLVFLTLCLAQQAVFFFREKAVDLVDERQQLTCVLLDGSLLAELAPAFCFFSLHTHVYTTTRGRFDAPESATLEIEPR